MPKLLADLPVWPEALRFPKYLYRNLGEDGDSHGSCLAPQGARLFKAKPPPLPRLPYQMQDEEDAEPEDDAQEDGQAPSDDALEKAVNNDRKLLQAHGIEPRQLVGWRCVPMEELSLEGNELRSRLGKAVVDSTLLRAPLPGAPLRTRDGLVAPAAPPTFAPAIRRKKPGKDVWRTVLRDPKGKEYWVTVPNDPEVEVQSSDLDPGPIKQPVGYPMACQETAAAIPKRSSAPKLRANGAGLARYAELVKEAREFLAPVPA
eukprot:TRINITY_DN17053_c0_g1_i1.p1 TRINITY_DN17053_c0_g1~~TRINITY_DN17053_c0_g1_i1.p1  ORF type:complete len:260 (-),score=51.40 TRINITY_DN17053_c0_g1_i1:175-954(-)